MTNKEIGKYGENLAKKYLENLGYKILDMNYKYSRYGEIDIIALYKNELCFVEVKTRRNNKFGTPMEAITKDKLIKIQLSAKNYIQEKKPKFEHYRIDAISIELKENKEEITHIKNIEF
ncbi:TPA: YraN family protein [Candidatus Galligastranaerophilus intestinigallinarum]|nr:YraN family protein [Candidatus Galligastranaerophilus intestinigallinarum]